MNLNQRTALITGASRGLGRALALALAKRGTRVVICARPSDELRSLEGEIRAHGGFAVAIAADISCKEEIYPLAAQAAELAGPVDLLINNASTLGPVPLQLLSDTDCEDLERTLETNLVGPFRLTKALLGSMILRETGLILNISSDAAVASYPGWGVYSASKAALDHLTRIWAEELRETSARFLSIDPGEMNTRMHADAVPEADPKSLAAPEDVAAEILAVIEESESIPSGSRIVIPERRSKNAGCELA